MWSATFLAFVFVAQVIQALYIPVEYVENIQDKEAWEESIASGWPAQPGQHPHQVSLRMMSVHGVVRGCGGSVVHREWVLTAAHCIASFGTIVVRAGLVYATRPEVMLEATEHYAHPTFDADSPHVVQANDIAVVKLPHPLHYSNNLRPIRLQPLSEAYRDYDEQILYASGFGLTSTQGLQSEQLMWVYLRGISNGACASLYGSFGTQFVTDNMICASFLTQSAASQYICQGERGGPLVHVAADGEPILVGLSSFVAGEPFDCHSDMPGAFIRPGPFHGWLKAITGIDFENLIEEDENEITTTSPSTLPTVNITELPTTRPPTVNITELPTTRPPTVNITELPTTRPPTVNITELPTTRPPTVNMTELPTTRPPTVNITELPTTRPPTVNITELPTTRPPTVNITELPTTRPPTVNITELPTTRPPTVNITELPTTRPPTVNITELPTTRPPTVNITELPTTRPPTVNITELPTKDRK